MHLTSLLYQNNFTRENGSFFFFWILNKWMWIPIKPTHNRENPLSKQPGLPAYCLPEHWQTFLLPWGKDLRASSRL